MPETLSQLNPPKIYHKNHKLFYFFIALLTVLLISFIVRAYFVLTLPTRIIEQVELLDPVFKDYHLQVTKISEDLLENRSSTYSESIKRKAENADQLSKEGINNLNILRSLVYRINIQPMNNYKNSLSKYLERSSRLIGYEVESVKIGYTFATVAYDFENSYEEIKEASTYIFTDSNQYISRMYVVNSTLNQSVGMAAGFDVLPEFEEFFNLNLIAYKNELELLENVTQSIKNRDTNSITTAQVDYEKKKLQNEADLIKVQNKFDEIVRNIVVELETLNNDINKESSSLLSQYNKPLYPLNFLLP